MNQKDFLRSLFFQIHEHTGIGDVREGGDKTFVITLNDEKRFDLLNMLDAKGVYNWLIPTLRKFENNMIYNRFDFVFCCSYWSTEGRYTRDLQFNKISFELFENKEYKVSQISLKVNRNRNAQ